MGLGNENDFLTVYRLASMNKGMIIILHHTDYVHNLLLQYLVCEEYSTYSGGIANVTESVYITKQWSYNRSTTLIQCMATRILSAYPYC